ncbi:MAG: VOC family protein [Bacteroidetes bacterium]|nr:VOC family protein [Bacteroidota bacterium]
MKFEIGETNIICSDLVKSLNFYKDVLGFEIVEKEDSAVRIRKGGQVFLLLPVANPIQNRPEYSTAPEISFDLLVDDIKEAVKYFQSVSVNILRPLSEDGSYLVIGDPDGLGIEVIQK